YQCRRVTRIGMAPPYPGPVATVFAEIVTGPIDGGGVVPAIGLEGDPYFPVKVDDFYIIWKIFLRFVHAFLPGCGSSGGCRSNVRLLDAVMPIPAGVLHPASRVPNL